MGNVTTIGSPPWTRAQIADKLDEFAEIYAHRPVRDNRGGMKAPHLFALWFMAERLSPDLIVESGVWKGQSTWLLETACPQATLVSIDLNLGNREYVSSRASYDDRDFAEHDWSGVTDRSLVFFDDHQDAYKRVQQCKWFGFKHMIFEDNYPPAQGDCYSLKKAFSGTGFDPSHIGRRLPLRRKLDRRLGLALLFLSPQYVRSRIPPNDIDARMLRENLDVYAEFPPVFKPDRTRWGDAWDESYPTPDPLLSRAEEPSHRLFLDEALWYNWICYARLR